MKYKVTTARGFTGPRRNRAGISVAAGQVYTFVLNDEQVAAIEADPMLVLEAVKEVSPKAEVKKTSSKKSAPKQMVDTQDTKEA